MTLIVVVLSVSASFAFWLLRRRSKLRGDEKCLEIPPSAVAGVVNGAACVILGAEEPLSYSPLIHSEEENKQEAPRPKPEPVEMLEPDAVDPFHQTLVIPPLSEEETLIPDKDIYSEIVVTRPWESTGEHVLENPGRSHSETSNQTVLEGKDDTVLASSSSFGQHLGDETVILEAASISDGEDGPHPEQIAPETEAVLATSHADGEEAPAMGAQSDALYDPQYAQKSDDRDSERTLKRYRPPSQTLPRQGNVRGMNRDRDRSEPLETTLTIRLRLTFDRFGFCTMGLLPERTADLDNEIAVKSGGISLYLFAQDEWYQDIPIGTFQDGLRQGIQLKGRLADRRYVRWLLTGRDIYVLATDPRASGFVSTARLSLGRSHVVLCAAELIEQVDGLLREAGCAGYKKLDESHGIPHGWVGIRDVSPTTPIARGSGSDPFYPLKPAPDIEIELEGGVRIRQSVWLAGYPPRAKLYGQLTGTQKILMDGKEVRTSTDGFLTVDGSDLPGEHFIYCEGLSCSRTYSIEEPPESWEKWVGYHFDNAAICGPLVQVDAHGHTFTGPMSNPLLLGAEPGQIFHCSFRNVAYWKGLVPFEVVWALPAQPLLCNKNTARILQFAEAPVLRPSVRKKFELGWCIAILDASRKGLQIENGSSNSRAQWDQYKNTARSIRRGRR